MSVFSGKQVTGYGLKSRIDRRPVTFSLGTVLSTEVHDGRLYANVHDYDNNAYHHNCPVACFGGGKDCFVFSPVVSTTSEDFDNFHLVEALLLHRDGGRPYVVAMKQNVQSDVQAESVDSAEDNSDRSPVFSKNDYVAHNAGSRLMLSDDGDVTLIVSKKYFRTQLPEDGRLRVSRDGEANERVILGNKFIDQFINNQLHAHLQAQNARISALEGQVAKLTQVLSSGVSVSSVSAPVAGSVAAVAGQVTLPPTGLTAFSPPAVVPVPTASDAHKSSTVELSSKAVGE